MTVQPPPPPAPRAPRGASRAIAILTAALGGAVIVGTLWTSAAPTVAAARERTEQSDIEIDVTRIDEIDIDVSAASFTLRFDDVDEATLEVRDTSRDDWTLREDDGTLEVSSPDSGVFRWFGGDNGRATLVLPRELEGADLSVDFGAGSFVADGRFGEVDLDVAAGQATLSGSADALTAQLGAGRAELDLADVRTAEFEVNAGVLTAQLRGTAPADVDITVGAGALRLTLPDEEYAVSTDISAGGFDNELRTSASAERRVSVEVAAGDVRLRAQ
jgi:hypothetical protein